MRLKSWGGVWRELIHVALTPLGHRKDSRDALNLYLDDDRAPCIDATSKSIVVRIDGGP
jgi:hypothetical protein